MKGIQDQLNPVSRQVAETSIATESPATLRTHTANSALTVSENEWTTPLEDNQRKEVTSKLLDPIKMYVSWAIDLSPTMLILPRTFETHSELMRARSKQCPGTFIRTFYETSATLSCFVTVDTHVKHRETPDLKIKEGNAFQAVAEFNINQYLTKEGIERHLVWNQKKNPSAFISAFNTLCTNEQI